MERDSDVSLPSALPVLGAETVLPATFDRNLLLKSVPLPSCEDDLCAQSAKPLNNELLTCDGYSVNVSDEIRTSQKNNLHSSTAQKRTISSENNLSRFDTEIDSKFSALPVASGNRAPKVLLQSTPLSSLPSGSLMRHLVALRDKQYLLSHKTPSGIPQVSSSVLTRGENSVPIGQRASAAKFTTSTPQLRFESLWGGQNEQGAVRYPFTELPLNVRSNIENSVPAAEVCYSHKAATAFPPLIIADENSPSVSTVAWADLPTSRLYDPNTYRSPPKLTSSNADTKKVSVPEHLREVDSYLISNSAASLKDVEAAPVPHLATRFCNSPREDDRPLSTSNKSFEELLSEKLKDKSCSPSFSSACPGPSKKFLKKGSGSSRFTSARSPLTNSGKSGEKDSAPLNDSSNSTKPKFPFLKKGTGTRRYNIKCVKLKKFREAQKLTPVANNVVPDGSFHQAEGVRCEEALNELHRIDRENEFDFMSPIRRVSFHRESEELEAFEALEELAEHSSFCSDASTVNNLLRRGLEYSVSSTPSGSPSTRLQRYPANILELEARRMAVCTDSPHPQRGGVGNAVVFKESARGENCESGDLRAKKSVQFCKLGAQVLEYRPHEDTINEVPPSSDASDLFSISDLEILSQMNSEGKLPATLRVESSACSESEGLTTPTDVQGDIRTSSHQILQFSPPRMPPDAASYAVWEAFRKKSKRVPARPASLDQDTSAKFEGARRVTAAAAQIKCSEESSVDTHKEEELEAHKVLLVSKVHELEKEIKTFQNENSVLARLRTTFAREKELFEREKRLFDEKLEQERKNMEQQFEIERNRLWREKCSLESNKQNKPQKDNVLEVINLKEEILMLKNELERRESMNNFTVNKLRNKVKELTSEKSNLESKVQKISSLEKENMSLKHQVDRLKLTSRAVYDKPAAKLKATVCQVNSAPAFGALRSQAHSKLATKAECGDTLKHKSVSFADENCSTTENSALEKNLSAYESAGTKMALSFADSYLANFSSGVSEAAAPASSAACSASAQSYSEENMSDGSKIITYANGNKKQILPSGCVIHEYYNGDRKETYRDRVVYLYSFDGTRQTTYLDGSEELQFPNGQMEIKRADTSIEVIFPDMSKTVKLPDGTEVHHNSDGTVVTSAPSGEKVIKFPSGQREVHGLGFKRREYPDGTTKVLYDDGSSETTYPNGRLRVKDQHGNVVSDTKLGLDLTEKRPV